MNTAFSPAGYSEDVLPSAVPGARPARRSLSWGAIFAGLSATLALQVLFMLLGAGLGFAIYSPITEENPVLDLGAGAVVVHGISAVFSLWFGGWIAGRFTPVGARATGWLHGFSVWCAATVAGVLFVSLGAGWVLGDLAKLVGGGLSMAGKPAAAMTGGATDLAKDALKQSGDALASFTDEAVGARPGNSTPAMNTRAKREVGMAVARLFNPMQQANVADNRTAVVKALVDHAGMSQATATQTVEGWTVTYDRMKADLAAAKDAAEVKARAAADKAATALSIFSLGTFAAFVIGALAAGFGGRHGAVCAVKCDGRAEPKSV